MNIYKLGMISYMSISFCQLTSMTAEVLVNCFVNLPPPCLEARVCPSCVSGQVLLSPEKSQLGWPHFIVLRFLVALPEKTMIYTYNFLLEKISSHA